jgi:hypothetical protein
MIEDEDWDEFDGESDEDGGPVVASAGEVTPVPWYCAACGEQNETPLDLSGGFEQEYTEDCAVCCRPNLISISVDRDSYEVVIGNELEYE